MHVLLGEGEHEAEGDARVRDCGEATGHHAEGPRISPHLSWLAGVPSKEMASTSTNPLTSLRRARGEEHPVGGRDGSRIVDECAPEITKKYAKEYQAASKRAAGAA